MAIVAFDLASFRARYPEFSSVPDPLMSAYFAEATIYLNNTDSSPVTNLPVRSLLLNMLTAHVAALNSGIDNTQASPLVGRISQATEGSVSVSAEMGPPSGTSAWFMQTKYGASFWQASLPYRSFRYIAGSSRPACA